MADLLIVFLNSLPLWAQGLFGPAVIFGCTYMGAIGGIYLSEGARRKTVSIDILTYECHVFGDWLDHQFECEDCRRFRMIDQGGSKE